MSTKDYVPYGPEWEKEMSKLSKQELIQFLKRTLSAATPAKPDMEGIERSRQVR